MNTKMSTNTRRTALVLRAGLLALALESGLIAIHALFFPTYFYQEFLLGRGWVQMLPPYNEHITRDLGALYLGFFVVLALAGAKLSKDLVNAAILGFAAATLPHMVFHALHTHDAPLLLDKVLQVGLLALTMAICGALLAKSRRHFGSAEAVSTRAGATSADAKRRVLR